MRPMQDVLTKNMAALVKISLMSAALIGVTACATAPPPAEFRAYKPVQQEKVIYVETKSTGEHVQRQSNELIKTHYNIRPIGTRNPKNYALVIGITKYQNATDVVYADYSAYAFRELATKAFGVPDENVLLMVNETATSGQIKSRIELIRELAEDGSKIYVYFAGHGVPGRDGNAYLLPADMSADAIHLEPSLMLNNIYQRLSQSAASNVYLVVDSCFSGRDDRGELLYKGVAPVLRTKKAAVPSNKLTILSAGGASDFANDLEDKRQRMFTYHLIKALEGGARRIDDVFPEVQAQVRRASLMKGIGYKQVPEIAGNTTAPLY